MDKPLFQTQFRQVDERLHSIRRQREFTQPHNNIDVFATSWFLMLFRASLNQIEIRHHDKWLKIPPGDTAIFYPPFSYIEYKIQPGRLDWKGYGSETFSEQLPKSPGYFSLSRHCQFESYKDVMKFLKDNQKISFISRKRQMSTVAEKTKRYLDFNFRNELSIHEMANELGLSYSTMTQDFKKHIGLAPKAYLKKLRVMYALHSIKVKGLSITDSCFLSGFNDVSRFGQYFKKTLGSAPTLYDNL